MDKNIWDYPVEEIVQGYTETEDFCTCVFCGESFELGRIYPVDERLYDAYGAVKRHVREVHVSAVDYLLERGPELTGISEIQCRILKHMAAGQSDKDISASLGIAQSTVRNHRFKLREKEKQSRMFLALMKSLEYRTERDIGISDAGKLETVGAGAAMVDERYAITQMEREKTIRVYMDENGAIKQFPPKAKKKIILMREVMKNFKGDVAYTEKEVNRILKRIYEADYPSLRRSLIEYGFMERTDDGSVYRVRE